MPPINLDSGTTAEELEEALRPKSASKPTPEPKSEVAGLTAKQKKEITKPANPTKIDA